MEPFLTVALFTALAGAAGVGTLTFIGRRMRREWSCTHAGHTIRLVATQNRKELFVDGRSVAAKTTLSGFGSSLTWTLQDERGPSVELTARIEHPGHGAPVGRIYAGGKWIGGEPDDLSVRAPVVPLPEPTDGRWAAARVLLADLRGATSPSVKDAAARVEAGLRDVLTRLDRLGAAKEAHATLGGDPAQVEAARVRLDAHVGELVDALRQLHLLSLQEGASPELVSIDDLLARVAADTEVAKVDLAGARRAAQAIAPR